jgi:hypothetical protein
MPIDVRGTSALALAPRAQSSAASALRKTSRSTTWAACVDIAMLVSANTGGEAIGPERPESVGMRTAHHSGTAAASLRTSGSSS